MLAEYGYQQFASPWSKDLSVYDDRGPALPVCDDIQLDLHTIELIDDGVLSEHSSYSSYQLNLLVDDDDTCSMGTSHLSSEFDEDGGGGGGDGGLAETQGDGTSTTSDALFDTDAITSCLNINSLHEISVQDIASINGMEMFVDSMLNGVLTSDIEVLSDDGSIGSSRSSQSNGSSPPNSPSSPRKRRRKVDHLPWSEVTHEERETLLESISTSVSNVLGPREQLELLRIIDPDIQTLPTDGQFTIEPDFLDNEKLEKMRKLINSHSVNNNETHIGENSACSNGTSTSNNSRPGRTRNSLPKSSQKKKQSKELKLQRRALRQQQRRENRQNLKEKRSGLFQKEEVLALEVHVEEEEIDILG